MRAPARAHATQEPVAAASMTVVELAVLVLFFLMAQKLADTYLGGYYSCPNCGARSSWRHSRDCPWRQRHPD